MALQYVSVRVRAMCIILVHELTECVVQSSNWVLWKVYDYLFRILKA